MDADGLPLIGPSVDYEKVAPINQKKTVEYLNHFIIHTAGFLNQFSVVCEEKLASLAVRIERLNIQTTLLEGKINSIPGLQNLSSARQTTTTAQPSEQLTASEVTSQNTSSVSQSEVVIYPSTDTETKEESVKEQPKNTISQDPRYMKYFKMLNIGVPEIAVKQKMALEGLNPDLLDNPSAPVPDSSSVTQTPTANNKDDDFSEDDSDGDDMDNVDSDGSASFSD